MNYIPKIVNSCAKNLEVTKVPGTEALFKCESIQRIERSNGVKVVVSYVYFPEGSKTFTEWEVEHGAIQYIRPFNPEEDKENYIKQHMFMKNAVIDWNQSAVYGRKLPDMIYNRDYKGIEVVLKDFNN